MWSPINNTVDCKRAKMFFYIFHSTLIHIKRKLKWRWCTFWSSSRFGFIQGKCIRRTLALWRSQYVMRISARFPVRCYFRSSALHNSLWFNNAPEKATWLDRAEVDLFHSENFAVSNTTLWDFPWCAGNYAPFRKQSEDYAHRKPHYYRIHYSSPGVLRSIWPNEIEGRIAPLRRST